MGFRDLVYRLYARRLESSLSPEVIPRHVGVMCDGNRRWARSAGLLDVASGHQKGADKIFELLEWCREAGVEVVTLWLLSTDNLARPAAELEPLLRIIEDTVRELVAERWHVNPMGALDLLPGGTARVLKDAAEATAGNPGLLVNVAIGTAAGAKSPTPSARCCTSTPPAAPRSRNSPRSWTSSTSPSTSTRPASPTPTSSSAPRANSGSAGSCCGRRSIRSSTSATPTGRLSARSTSFAPCAPTRREIAASAPNQSQGPRAARPHGAARPVTPAAVAATGGTARVTRRRTTARPPFAGALVMPRECHRSSRSLVGTSENSRSMVRSTTFISMVANAAPRQRRAPPPNGIHWYRSGLRRGTGTARTQARSGRPIRRRG